VKRPNQGNHVGWQRTLHLYPNHSCWEVIQGAFSTILCGFGAFDLFNWLMSLASLGSPEGKGFLGRVNQQLQCTFEFLIGT